MRIPPHAHAFSYLYTCILLLFGVCSISPVAAQQYGFSHLTVNDGLAQSSVYGIYQDKQGFMWFGTSDGLNRYDGVSMRTYKHQPNERLRGTGNFYGKNAVEDDAGNIYFSFDNSSTYTGDLFGKNGWNTTPADITTNVSVKSDVYFTYNDNDYSYSIVITPVQQSSSSSSSSSSTRSILFM